jgi:hypothetical protein
MIVCMDLRPPYPKRENSCKGVARSVLAIRHCPNPMLKRIGNPRQRVPATELDTLGPYLSPLTFPIAYGTTICSQSMMPIS